MKYPQSKTKPWDHQIEAWDNASQYDSYYLAMQMGTGKSKVAVDYCNGFDARRVLILCPKKVIEVWPHQFDLHSNLPYKVFAPEKGTVKKKTQLIEKHLRSNRNNHAVVVLNFESFWRAPLGPSVNAGNRVVDPGLLCSRDWDVVILDEGHRIKSPGGRASWGAARLRRKADRRLVLSGTPMPHSPLDIYAQFRFLDPGIFGKSFANFRANYAEMGGYESKQVVKFKNLDDLNAKFYSKAFRVEKSDVLTLPPTMHEIRTCELSPAAARIYARLDREFTVKVQTGEITAGNALVKLLRLAQLAGGYAKFDDGTRQVMDSGKIDTAVDILKDLPPTEPAIIFARFTNEIQRLKAAIEKDKDLTGTVGVISDGVNQLAEWQQGDHTYLISQVRSGGEGIDCTRASYCIFLSVGFSNGDYEQMLARIDRPGQTRPVTYYHIIARGTVDQKIQRAIKDKRKIIDSTLEQTRGVPFAMVA